MLADKGSSPVEAELHDGSEEIRLGDDLSPYERLFDVVDKGRGRHTGRVVHLKDLSLCREHLIGHIRDSRDDIHVELAEKPLLDDFKMKQAKETAAES